MHESTLINLSLFILFLPLLGFIVTLLLGKKVKSVYIFENLIIIISFFSSVYLLFSKLTNFRTTKITSEIEWFSFNNFITGSKLSINIGLMIDNITAIMLFVVALISMLVHLYSIEYMKGDERYNRYFAYLGIFTFSMNGIVLTNNILMMYIFWELVGLSSYLLIGFWFEKKSAADASKKAFIVNRIGDIGMFAGILILFFTYQTFSFDKIFGSISSGQLPFNSDFWLTFTGILLFCGAIGKSAQFPLHVWLPDAMEGPTPVSALIHAATMVAAGVYLVVRIFGLLTADAMLFIGVIGMISAFIPATIALTQNDIKKVLAYSTISQLGYMIMALGVGAYQFAFFHLVTHAFFKAALFLGSGSVIHAMHHEQDIRNMGGLKKKMPLTYWTFVISSLAISGIPLTSGFLSKDGIIASSLAFAYLTGHYLFPIFSLIVALLTAFYMFRLIILTFHGEPRDHHKFEHAHESPFLMVMPLVLLAVLSIFIWYTPNPLNSEQGWVLSKWIEKPVIHTPENSRFDFMKSFHNENVLSNKSYIDSEVYKEAMHSAHYPAMGLSLFVAVLGIFLAFAVYQWKKINSDLITQKLKPLYNFSYNKWYFDEIYHKTFVALTIGLSKVLAWFDAKIIDGIVNGSAFITKHFSFFIGNFDKYVVDGIVNFTAYFNGFAGLFVRRIQTGKVQSYLALVIFSIVILLFIFK
ncbi:MAG: NADH-quinone oxidoreductase subunit L [Ignavibacterium sp.]|nr:NADH-quinone oxidoreductase subunit L [Ignavibacterium sp.]